MVSASPLSSIYLNQIEEANNELQAAAPEEILRWALDTYPTLTMATAFGAEGCVLISMLAGLPGGKQIRIFNLDTGYQFPETLELRDTIAQKYGIEVELVKPAESVEAMEARLGGPIYKTAPDECCRMRKIVPLTEALVGHVAWITAIRSDQTDDRSRSKVVEWDAKFGLVKINPLLHWTRDDVWNYISVNEVPYNPLHIAGFPSIGCWPCTRAVDGHEDERSGRWSWTGKTECGLHKK